nr:MAG TPA: hypothetical protein [Caudoviricetes sp.]
MYKQVRIEDIYPDLCLILLQRGKTKQGRRSPKIILTTIDGIYLNLINHS